MTLYDTDEITALGSGIADAGGNFSITSTALGDSEGEHTITATARDAAGNVSVLSESLVVTIDRIAPAAPDITGISNDSGASSSDGTTNDPTLSIFGTGVANSTIEVLDGGVSLGTTTADESGNWILDYTGVSLSEGSHSIAATATDAAGNTSAFSTVFNITIDTAAPAAPTGLDLIASSDTGTSSSDDITSDDTPTITGSAESGSLVTLYDTDGTTVLGTATANGSGNWSITSSVLADGEHADCESR